MAPVETTIPKFSLDPEIPLDSKSLSNLKSPKKFEDKDEIVSSVILGVVGSCVEKAEKNFRNKKSKKKGRLRTDEKRTPLKKFEEKKRIEAELKELRSRKEAEEKRIKEIDAELKSIKEAEEKRIKEIETVPNEEASPIKKTSGNRSQASRSQSFYEMKVNGHRIPIPPLKWGFVTKEENGSRYFQAESVALIEASEKWNEKIEEQFKKMTQNLLDDKDEDHEVENILTEFGEDNVDMSEPMFAPHSTPTQNGGNFLDGQMKFEHAADNKFKPFDYTSMYSKGRFGEVGNNPIDWFKKAAPYQVTKKGKSDILTPENIEENGKPSTIFKSFDAIDLHELRKESEVFDYEKVLNSNDVEYRNNVYDIHKVYDANDAYKGNIAPFKAFDMIDLMSEVRKDFGVHKQNLRF